MENTNKEFNKDSKVKTKLERLEDELKDILKKANFIEVKFIKKAIENGDMEIEDILDMVDAEEKGKFKEWIKGFATGVGSIATGVTIGAVIMAIVKR